jgi:hypothetical protein
MCGDQDTKGSIIITAPNLLYFNRPGYSARYYCTQNRADVVSVEIYNYQNLGQKMPNVLQKQFI